MNKKGFTLIELLAVIVILGVILVIAIPSISAAILNSRKNAYVATANEFVDGLRMMTLTDPTLLPSGTDSTCKSLSLIKLEKGSSTRSPFGKDYTNDSEVCVAYNSTTNEYDYSVCLVDAGGNSICDITTESGSTTYDPVDVRTVTKDTVAIGGSSGNGGSSGEELGYTFKSCLEATGTQYIDTGYVFNSLNNKMIIHGSITSGTGVLIGATDETDIKGSYICGSSSGARVKVVVGDDINLCVNNVTSNYGTDFIATIENDMTCGRYATTQNNTTHLFALNTNGTIGYMCNGKIYSVAFYEGEKQVHYFLPAIRNSDGEIGMYDIITGEFKMNAGTGTFNIF